MLHQYSFFLVKSEKTFLDVLHMLPGLSKISTWLQGKRNLEKKKKHDTIIMSIFAAAVLHFLQG